MRCVICDGQQFKTVTDKLRFGIKRRVVRCEGCSLVSLEEPHSSTVDYSGTYRERHGPVLGKKSSAQEIFETYAGAQQERLALAGDLVSEDSEILEVGCSSGQFLSGVSPLVRRAVGIEPGREQAKFAREELGLEVYEGALGSDRFPIGKFDAIFMFHVLEHISDPLVFLRECSLHLKVGGKICIEVPNIDDALITVYNLPQFRGFYFREPHVYYYSKETLIRLLTKAGFSGEVTMTQMYPMTNHINWLLTGSPQPEARMALSSPKWSPLPGWEGASNSLGSWLEQSDDEYKRVLAKHGITDCISYVGNQSK